MQFRLRPGRQLTDFTPNGAVANWQCVLNENIDDNLYVSDPTAGHNDLYDGAPLVNNPTIFDVQVVAFVRQTDATQRFYKNQLKVGGLRSGSLDGARTYAGVTDIFELNPATGIGFTGAQVNATQFGPYIDVSRRCAVKLRASRGDNNGRTS